MRESYYARWMRLAAIPIAVVVSGLEGGETPGRVFPVDTLGDCPMTMAAIRPLVDEAGDFDGDGLDEIVCLLDDIEYYVLYGQTGLWGKRIDSVTIRAIPGLRRTHLIVPDVTPTRLAVGGGGDVNGDPLDDIVIGAGEKVDCTGETCQFVVDHPIFYLIFGQEGGYGQKADVEALFASGKASKLIPPEEWTGWGRGGIRIEFVGDMNGDGYGEVAIAAGGVMVAGTRLSGGVTILFGGAHLAGRTFHLADVCEWLPGIVVKGIETGESIGGPVVALGDIDGDGYRDVAFSGDWGLGFSARLFLIYGGPDIAGCYTPWTLPEDSAAVLVRFKGPAALGDLDGDGFDDYLVGPSAMDGTVPTLRVAYGGKRLTGWMSVQEFVAQARSVRIDKKEGIGNLATTFGGKDIDGDAIPEFGYAYGKAAVKDAGRFYVILGRRSFPPVITYGEIPLEYGVAIEGVEEGNLLGDPVIFLSDFDGDRFGEIIALPWRGDTYVIPWPCLTVQELSIRRVEPSAGSRLGGMKVRVFGSGFDRSTEVWFGDRLAKVEELTSSAAIVVTAPPHPVGTVDVAVKNGAALEVLEKAFTYDDRFTRDLVAGGSASRGVEFSFSETGKSIDSAALVPDIDGDRRADVALLEARWDGGAPRRLHLFFRPDALPSRVDLSSSEMLADHAVIEESPSAGLTAICGAGDLNGDGVADLLLSQHNSADRTRTACIIAGRAEFPERSTLSELEGTTTIDRGEAACRPGWFTKAAVVKDLDGDGRDEIVTVDSTDTRCSWGAVLIYGSAEIGSVAELNVDDLVARGEAAFLTLPGVRVGLVAGGTDIDRDGNREVALLAGTSFIAVNMGARRTGIVELSDAFLTGAPCVGHRLAGVSSVVRSLSLGGDFDGDGWPDIAFGSVYSRSTSGDVGGAATLLSGVFSKEMDCTGGSWWDSFAQEVIGSEPRLGFGCEVAPAGDWNGDGLADLLVGATGDYWPDGVMGIPGRRLPGAAYLLLGRSDFFSRGLTLDGLRRDGLRIRGPKSDWWLGTELSPGQDVDGDGYDDIILVERAAPWESPPQSGSAYLIFGRSMATFVRGDATDDRAFDLSDPILVLNHLFAEGADLWCPDAGDIDDDGRLTLGDPIYLLNFLFAGGNPPKPPYPEPGEDPTADPLPCAE